MITITGGDGFIGKHLQDALFQFYYEVYDLKRDSDICDMTADDIGETVIHLAAVSSIPQSFQDPEETMRTNMLGLAHVIKLCEQNKSKLIFASSSSVYDPLSPYAYSKLWGEQLLEMSNIDYVVLRFANVYGEGDNKSAIHHFLNNDKITIYGYGGQVRSFIYVRDVVRAIKESINWDKGEYNLATEQMSINEVAKLFDKEIAYEKEREGDSKYLAMISNFKGNTKLADWLKK